MHTVNIQPIASERLKHLETRGSNEVCGSLVTVSPIASERLKAVTLSRRERYRHPPILGKFLCNASCECIEQQPCVDEFSPGTELHSSFCDNGPACAHLITPFFLEAVVLTEEAWKALDQRTLRETFAQQFCGHCPFTAPGVRITVTPNHANVGMSSGIIRKEKDDLLCISRASSSADADRIWYSRHRRGNQASPWRYMRQHPMPICFPGTRGKSIGSTFSIISCVRCSKATMWPHSFLH